MKSIKVEDIKGFEEEVINECLKIENIVKELLEKQKKNVLKLIDEEVKKRGDVYIDAEELKSKINGK